MPDLGNLSLSQALELPHYPNLNPPAEPSDLTSSLYTVPVKTLGNCYISSHNLLFPVLQQDEAQSGNDFKVSKRSRGSLDRINKAANDKGSEDHVKDWSEKKIDSGFCRLSCTLPFLVGAPKMAECLFCHHSVYPGNEAICSVRGCERVYHVECAKEAGVILNLKKFKCPHHVSFMVNLTLISFVIGSDIQFHDIYCSNGDDHGHMTLLFGTSKMLHIRTAFYEQSQVNYAGFDCIPTNELRPRFICIKQESQTRARSDCYLR